MSQVQFKYQTDGRKQGTKLSGSLLYNWNYNLKVLKQSLNLYSGRLALAVKLGAPPMQRKAETPYIKGKGL